ncbi:hypothetical protein [Agrobacterium pusense]|uniref:Uncharacterized protein n=1 Tax=Agrobacterium pusense TaxID=648995 RepID=A0A6H0ZKJ3_9HYPH|nr:hypothetical protein [Agrobacterium pusense]MDH2091163.1 hypothetical protein [Agrobacterium pusense]QIX21318.1 hypothetical protein FOB41_09300 [Agrobacterium pusense]QWW73168.1 hypothetical protein KP800_10600 [Agrobacterium pusense]
MTVIIIFEDLRTVVVDCLVSNEDPTAGSTTLLTTGSTHHISPHLRRSPRYLMRKSFPFNFFGSEGRLFLTGTVDEFQKYANRVLEVCSGTSPIWDGLQSEIIPGDARSYLNAVFRETQIFREANFTVIGYLDGEIYSSRPVHEFRTDIPYFGNTLICGSGTELMQRELLGRGNEYQERFPNDCLEIRSARSLRTTPSIIIHEDTMDAFRTLDVGVGGYVECYRLQDRGLAPRDHLITAIISLRDWESQGLIEIRRLFFHYYEGETLIAVSLASDPNSRGSGFWRLAPGSLLQIPNSCWIVARISSLAAHEILTPSDIPSLFVKMNVALEHDIKVQRGWNRTLEKRFSGAYNLFNIVSNGESCSLTINRDCIKNLAHRYPPGGRDDDPPINWNI